MGGRLVVVARNEPALCDYLSRQFDWDEEVQVVLDRRQGEQRRRFQPHKPAWRRADRRQESVRAEDLRTHGFVIVRRKPELAGLRDIEELIAESTNHLGGVRLPSSTQGVDEKPSRQGESTEGVPASEQGRGSNGHSIRKGELSQMAMPSLSEEPFGTPPASSFDPGEQEWRDLLREVGIPNLRLPENGYLCLSWREFLNELRNAKSGQTAKRTAWVTVGEPPHQHRWNKRVQREGTVMERIASVKTRHPDPQWKNEKVRIQSAIGWTPGDRVRYLFIVSREQIELYDRLRQDFSEEREIHVILDRRQGERRQMEQRHERDRRRGSRRRHPETWTVTVEQLYRGERPCFLLLGEELGASHPVGREKGPSFFHRGKAAPRITQ